MAQTPCKKVGAGGVLDYVTTTDRVAGEVVVINGFAGIVECAVAAGEKAALDSSQMWDVPKITGAIADRAPVYWDADGSPVSGTAGSGGADDSSDSGANAFLGWAVGAAASGDEFVRVHQGRHP